MITLPEAFEQEMKQLLGEEEYEAYCKTFDEAVHRGLRVNNGKISTEEFLRRTDIPLKKVPWIPNGFYYDEESCNPAKDADYYAGLYYLQEPSAMTPASRLPIEPDDRVLDLCAAPGGKATELGSRIGEGGMLLANDICARFSSLSNKFRTAGDSHLQILAASLMGPEDVVLFISYSGATRDMLETLRTAKASGAKIILLTHYEDSPGAAMADVVLRCGAQESPLDSGSIPIKVAVLYVGEVLLLRYMLDDPEHTNEAQDRTSEAVAIKLI